MTQFNNIKEYFMKKSILISTFLLSFSFANDGYIQLSSLEFDDLKQNNFVSISDIKDESSWVNLSKIENKKSNLTNIVDSYDITESNEYISLSVYDTEMMLESSNTEYVALEKINKIEDYDILAIYDEMIKEENQEFLTMNFDF